MADASHEGVRWRDRFFRELSEFALIALYLALFFGSFTWYRRLILAQYGISYLHYGIALAKALILAHVIHLGDSLHLARRAEQRPLIYTVLSKTVLFALLAMVLKMAEDSIAGFARGRGLTGGFEALRNEGIYELGAECLVVFSAFIPFFAFRELGRVLGKGKLAELFLRKGPPPEAGHSGPGCPGLKP